MEFLFSQMCGFNYELEFSSRFTIFWERSGYEEPTLLLMILKLFIYSLLFSFWDADPFFYCSTESS